MFWNEKGSEKPYQVPDDVVDLQFRINCKCLPLEHAGQLSSAIHEVLPWIAEEEQAGVHLIHGAESGNGWQRPENAANELLHLSKRIRMSLRMPKHRIDDAHLLTGNILRIDQYEIEVGKATIKPLSIQGTIFSRYVISHENETEDQFLQRIYDEIKSLNVNVNKLLCGKTHRMQGREQELFTRSVMLAELKPQDSVKVQQYGLGTGRTEGCGLFVPHKGIEAVKDAEEPV